LGQAVSEEVEANIDIMFGAIYNGKQSGG